MNTPFPNPTTTEDNYHLWMQFVGHTKSCAGCHHSNDAALLTLAQAINDLLEELRNERDHK